MQRSTDRILTTHAGSLPRPPSLLPMVFAQESGESVDADEFEAGVRSAVKETVRKQVVAGVDVVNDGEVSKPSYATYVKDRLTGFGGEGSIETVAASVDGPRGIPRLRRPHGRDDGVGLRDQVHDLRRPGLLRGQAPSRPTSRICKAALDGESPAGTFMSAASPGVIAVFSPNKYYSSQEEYLEALSNAMREEYEAIHEAGFILQLDCPDFAMTAPGAGSLENFRRQIQMSVEALNQALVNIPAEATRIHICWGNGEMPRTSDVELKDIIDLILQAKPAGLMLMASNGRHAHEWTVFEDVKLPDDKYVIPGVLDSTTNVVEHPEAIAQRLTQYAQVVGRENVMAGTDCGFGTVAGMQIVVPSVVWAKFSAMREGAELATERLWG